MNEAKPAKARPPALRIEDLEVSYANGHAASSDTNGGGAMTALEIPRLNVPPGELLAVTGPSGSGKSTFLYAIGGLLRPRRGRVLWDEHDILKQGESARDRWRRHTVGFAFQDFHLLPELTPLQNVLLPASFERFSAPPAVRKRAISLLDHFAVPQARRSTASLSRGEQQRVAIARALLFDPPVILADEPTASLDAKAGGVVIDILLQLSRQEGRTVIAISHDQELLKRFANVVTLDHGRIAGQQANAFR